MSNIFVVMPAYNEQDNIKEVVENWYPIVETIGNGSSLIIADSGSYDMTHTILSELKKEYSNLIILSNTEKKHGPKVLALYRYALNNNVDFIFQTDSDGQTNPDEFYEFWELKDKYDAIIGNRIHRGDGKIRSFVEKVVCLLLRIIFGVKVPDANAPFRLMNSSLVNKYIDRFAVDYNLPNIMFTTFFSYYKENILFKEISFKSRQAGVNSINMKKIIKIGINAIKDFIYFRKGMKNV